MLILGVLRAHFSPFPILLLLLHLPLFHLFRPWAAAAATTATMRTLFLLALILPIIYFVNSKLPGFYIFDPARLQELSQEAIARGDGNTTVIMHHLVQSLQKEYGPQHVNGIEADKWFFK